MEVSNRNITYRTEIQYRAIVEALVPSLALMVITFSAMKVSGRLFHTRMTPFQGQLPPTFAFIALSTAYIATCVHLAPPFYLEVKEELSEGMIAGQLKDNALSSPVFDQSLEPSKDKNEQKGGDLISSAAAKSTLQAGRNKRVRNHSLSNLRNTFFSRAQVLIPNRNLLQADEWLLQMCLQGLRRLEEGMGKRDVVQIRQQFILGNKSFEVCFDLSTEGARQGNINIVRKMYRMLKAQVPTQKPLQRRLLVEQKRNNNVQALLQTDPPPSVQENIVDSHYNLQQEINDDKDKDENFINLNNSTESKSVQFDEMRHGRNGSQMRKMLHQSLHEEYIYLLQEQYKIDVHQILQNLSSETKENRLLKATLELLVDKDASYVACLEKHQELVEYYTSHQCNQEVIRIARAFARVRMLPAIYSYQEELVREHTTLDKNLTAANYHKVLVKRNKEVKGAPSAMKMDKATRNETMLSGSTSFCNYFAVNPPNLLRVLCYEKEGELPRMIYKLRHGTPHVPQIKLSLESIRTLLQTLGGNLENLQPQNWGLGLFWNAMDIIPALNRGPKINPIYEEFLRAAAERKEGVLYAVHQLRGRIFEGHRVETIIELEARHPNLLILVQSVEDDLFEKGAKTFAELKEKLIAGFKQDYDISGSPIVKPNRLPKCLHENNDYVNAMAAIFDFVHQTFFDRRGEIDQTQYDIYGDKHWAAEWQACILLFHHYQREDLKFRDLLKDYPICYENTACKDNFDRALQHNTISIRVQQTQLYGEVIPVEELEALLTTSQAPPIQGKGKEIISHRLQPALLASKIIADCKQIEAIQRRTEYGWQLVSSEVIRRKGQHAVLPNDASLEEGFILL